MPRISAAKVRCPRPEHAGSRVKLDGTYGKAGHRRQRYKCSPREGGRPHVFTELLPREESWPVRAITAMSKVMPIEACLRRSETTLGVAIMDPTPRSASMRTDHDVRWSSRLVPVASPTERATALKYSPRSRSAVLQLSLAPPRTMAPA